MHVGRRRQRDDDVDGAVVVHIADRQRVAHGHKAASDSSLGEATTAVVDEQAVGIAVGGQHEHVHVAVSVYVCACHGTPVTHTAWQPLDRFVNKPSTTAVHQHGTGR